jgi:hypothetical protein
MVYSKDTRMAIIHAKKSNSVVLHIPSWASLLFIVLGLVLIPWTVFLGSTLPPHHFSAHWDISWTGLDIALILSLICTGLFSYMKSLWLIITASTAGSLLLVDAWFDVMSERGAAQLHQAILLALIFEIPLAIMSYYLAFHTIKQNKK